VGVVAGAHRVDEAVEVGNDETGDAHDVHDGEAKDEDLVPRIVGFCGRCATVAVDPPGVVAVARDL
jgi:hypothetical protein